MEKLLLADGQLRVEWWRGDLEPLRVFRKGAKYSSFSAGADQIYKLSEAPQSVRDRANRQLSAAGRTASADALVAGHPTMGPVFLILTPAIASQVRDLLPQALAEAEAYRQRETERQWISGTALMPTGVG